MTESQFIIFRVIVGVVLVGIVAAICVSDTRERRIPNNLVLAGLLLALIFNSVTPLGYGLFDYYTPGGVGFAASAYGALAVFVLFFALYALRIMGAGDVKLMAFFGALFGGLTVIDFTVTVFLCGGLLALSRMFNAERRAKVLMNLKLITLDRIVSPTGRDQSFDPNTDTAERLPFALAICGAATVVAVSQFTGLELPWSVVA
ncbi:MAG: A24 family peptidase [Burkholderiaceae bacterium]